MVVKPSLLIVGIGNPGLSYARTRHNVGFQALDLLGSASGEGEWKPQQKFDAVIMEARVVTAPVLLVKPTTYVNRSGESIRKLVDFYKLDPAGQVLVVVDDIDLPLAQLRLRMHGGPGTHNGLKSIVETIGEGFARIRIGLGLPQHGEDLANWVLSIPPPEEQAALEGVYATLPEVVRSFVMGEQGNA